MQKDLANDILRNTVIGDDGEYDDILNVWFDTMRQEVNKKTKQEFRTLGTISVLDIVTPGRLRWLGHVKHKEGSDLVKACRYLGFDDEKENSIQGK